MNEMTNWNNVDVPSGSYIGWGNTPGQTVTGKLLSLDPTGGTDYNNNACPELGIELLEATQSYNKEGQQFDHAAGELVNITAGGANLKRGVSAAIGQGLAVGDLIKISLDEIKPLSGGRAVKVFSLAYAKGSGAAAPAPAPTQAAAAPAPAPQAAPTPPAAAAAATPPAVSTIDLTVAPEGTDPTFWASLDDASRRAYYTATGKATA